MRFQHRFVVHAPLHEVRAFHAATRSMAAITPPPIRVRVHEAPESLGEGDVMRFTLLLGPLPLPWAARFSDVGPEGFTDEQVEGPFALWRHRHAFVPLSGGRTEVRDTIVGRLDPHPVKALIGLSMWLGLPVLFAYRARRTRALLGPGLR